MPDMWDLHDQGCWVVVPTNCMVREDETAVMGGGIARQAADKFPELPVRYGNALLDNKFFYEDFLTRIMCYPTKIDWKDPSRLCLIELIVLSVQRFIKDFPNKKVVVPAIGCGLGGLDWDTEVSPMLQVLRDDPEHFIVLDPI